MGVSGGKNGAFDTSYLPLPKLNNSMGVACTARAP